jgi:hypothetical protein
LVIRKIVYFQGFFNSEGIQQTGRIISAPEYMLVEVPGSQVKVGHFHVGVIPLKRSDLSFSVPKTSIGAKSHLISSILIESGLFPLTLFWYLRPRIAPPPRLHSFCFDFRGMALRRLLMPVSSLFREGRKTAFVSRDVLLLTRARPAVLSSEFNSASSERSTPFIVSVGVHSILIDASFML